MQRPKFNFGDIVECEFSGAIEGVPVTVKKRLFVQGLSGYMSASKLYFNYNVCENDPAQYAEAGRVYQKEERELMELEPLIQEMERTNRKFVAPAVNQIDQMEAVRRAFIEAQKANQLQNPWQPWQTASSGTSAGSPDYGAGLSNVSQRDYSDSINALSSIAGSGSSHMSAGALPEPANTTLSEALRDLS